jgi:hypothetical protein
MYYGRPGIKHITIFKNFGERHRKSLGCPERKKGEKKKPCWGFF